MRKKFTLLIATLMLLTMVLPWKAVGQTPSAGTFIIDFYDEDKLSSTSGTGLTNSNYSSFVQVPTGLTVTDVVTGVSVTGTVRYGMNGGLTAGTGSAAGPDSHYVTFNIGSDYAVTKCTVYATKYEDGRWLLNGDAAASGTLGSKGSVIADVTDPLIWDNLGGLTALTFKKDNGSGGNQKRLTIYRIVCEYSTGSSQEDPTITFNNSSVYVGHTLDLSTLFTSNSNGAVSYTITSGGSFASIDENVITGVAVGSVTVEASQTATSLYNAATVTATITVSAAPELSSIAITTPPAKTTYVEGETFDATGMVVTATYSNDFTDVVTASCTWTPNVPLTTGDTEITVSYTENAVTKTATQSIVVNAYSQPTSFDIALNNTAFGCDVGNNAVEQSFTINNTVIVAGCTSSASSKTYYGTDHVRFYADSYLKITSPSGYKITETVFTANGTWNGSINVNTGTYTNGTKTWEGETDQLNFSFDAQNRIASIAITLALPSSIVAPTFDPDGGTYTTTQSVTISTTTDGATIYYTLDGTTPTSSSTSYSSAISVSETMTIKAIAVLGSDESTVASATYTILPILHAGTESDPYTVADARNAIDVNGTIDNAYVSGIISQVDGYDSEYHSITYWISDDGTTTNQLEVYSGKGIDGADFSAVTDVLAGAAVTVKGQLKKFNNVYEFNYNNQLVSYTPPTNPSVTPNSFLIEALATSGLSGTLTVTYANITTVAADVWFCNAAGTEAATYSWIVADVNSENNVEYLIEENTGVARTAYFKVWAYDNNLNQVYSDVVTVNQAGPDFATLPFNWAGGMKSELNGQNGVTVTADDEDYAAGNAPYRIKFNTDGHNIVIKTNEQPAAVSVGIKKFGSGNASTLIIEGSVDGTSYSEVESFDITGSQNKTFTYYTTNAFDTDYRYVRIYFNKPSSGGSNIGVGPIIVRGIETYTKSIIGYGNSAGGYVLLASPINGADPVGVGMITDQLGATANAGNSTYDLYWFDQTAGAAQAWRNYRQETFNLAAGKGYLYASKNGVDLTFTGTPNLYGTVTLVKNNVAGDLEGWNLVGNPFGENAYIDRNFYAMNPAGTDVIQTSGAIAPMQGVFVVAASDGESLTFSTTAPSSNNNNNGIAMNLSQTFSTRGDSHENVIDRAMVRFGEGDNLPKFQINPSNTKLYIPQDGKDYAVIRSEARGEMPVNFKAAETGTYTISVETENLDVNYLHLIDNMTGMDVDLLATPSYTFEGKKSDYASRFKLVFSANADNNETNEDFAFVSDGNIIILNEGEATLQVIDIMGRVISTQTVNGNASVNNVGAAGVYVLQLINGNNVKTQKIVVR